MGSAESEQVLRALYVVYSKPADGTEDEFHKWYDQVHIPELLAIPGGFDSAQRFQVARTQYGPDTPDDFPYLTVYEINHDVDEAFAAIDAARKAGNLTPPPGPAAQTRALVWVPLGERGRVFAGQVAR
jgi:hypothetical protein